MNYEVKITKDKKIVFGPNYNYSFDMNTGYFARWGNTLEDNPTYSPIGPEILDIEITTKCNGINGKLCSYCYKSNTQEGYNMSFETFKSILDKVNENQQLCQLAFGLGSTGEENPDIWKMCEYARSIHVIPNGTIADITDETANKIVKYFGACAVSNHSKDSCYDSVKKLTDRGLTQTNIHAVIYSENLQQVFELIDDIAGGDERLSRLNAVVFLSLKKTGRATNGNTTQLTQDEFNSLINYALEKNISFGFDSCSAHKFINFINANPQYKQFETYVEPCESGVFSSYIDVHGKFHPCSFCEHKKGMYNIDCNEIKSFTKEVWFDEKTNNFRDKLLKADRHCPIFKI